jgi:hypothetical protein
MKNYYIIRYYKNHRIFHQHKVLAENQDIAFREIDANIQMKSDHVTCTFYKGQNVNTETVFWGINKIEKDLKNRFKGYCASNGLQIHEKMNLILRDFLDNNK